MYMIIQATFIAHDVNLNLPGPLRELCAVVTKLSLVEVEFVPCEFVFSLVQVDFSRFWCGSSSNRSYCEKTRMPDSKFSHIVDKSRCGVHEQ